MDDPASILKEVRPSLAQWNIQPTDVQLVSHSENIVYKVTAQDQKNYALRVHRPGYHSLEALNSEQIWTAALLETGARVPKAYPTIKGDYYTTVHCGGMYRQVGLIGWLEGEPLTNLIPPDGEDEFPFHLIKDAGVICAKFHNQATGWNPPPQFTRHHLNVEGFVGETPFWGRFWEVKTLTVSERRTIEKLRDLVTRQLEIYGERPATYSMIHADMHEDNLFVTDRGLMVIDFDDAGFGWHQYDLAVALFSFNDRSDFDAIQKVLIEGYRTERTLSDEDLSMLNLFLLVRTLALIGWASARPEVGKTDYLPYLIDKACCTKI